MEISLFFFKAVFCWVDRTMIPDFKEVFIFPTQEKQGHLKVGHSEFCREAWWQK